MSKRGAKKATSLLSLAVQRVDGDVIGKVRDVIHGCSAPGEMEALVYIDRKG